MSQEEPNMRSKSCNDYYGPPKSVQEQDIYLSERSQTSLSTFRTELNIPDRWILESVEKEQVVYVDVRQLTFPVKIKKRGNPASKNQTVKWLADVVCDHYSREFDFMTDREQFTAIDVIDRTGIRLMPDTKLCDLLEWIPNLHPICTVMQRRDFASSKSHRYGVTIWCAFRYMVNGLCENYVESEQATISLCWSEQVLRESAENDIGEDRISGASVWVLSEDWEEPDYFSKEGRNWKVRFQVSTDRLLKLRVEIHKQKL